MNRKYIRRAGGTGYPGWLVCLAQIKIVAPPGNKFFSDKKYDGKMKALNTAMKWRDARLRDQKQLRLLDSALPTTGRVRNTSGVVGVAYQKSRNGCSGRWMARMKKSGKYYNKSFSVNAYGYKEAFNKACEARYIQSGNLIITVPMDKLPCIPKVPYEIHN